MASDRPTPIPPFHGKNKGDTLIPPLPKEPEVKATISLESIAQMLNNLAAGQRDLEARLDRRPQSRGAPRQEMRKRQAARTVMGRNGEILSRRLDDSDDPFQLPEEFVEQTRREGFGLEWKTESIYGQDQITYQSKMHANGWRPVLNSRLPGVYAREGDEGAIRHDQMILMERPLILIEEAREEERRKASDQVRMKHESWGVDTPNSQVFDPNTPMAQSFTIKPHSSEPELMDPAWQQQLEIAEGG